MTQTNPTKTRFRVIYLLMFDVPTFVALAFLIEGGIVPLYPWGAVAYLLVFVVTGLLAWALTLHPTEDDAVQISSVPLSLWVAASIFTPAGIAAIIASVVRPSLPHGVQAVMAVLLVGYIWYLVYRISRVEKARLQSRSCPVWGLGGPHECHRLIGRRRRLPRPNRLVTWLKGQPGARCSPQICTSFESVSQCLG